MNPKGDIMDGIKLNPVSSRSTLGEHDESSRFNNKIKLSNQKQKENPYQTIKANTSHKLSKKKSLFGDQKPSIEGIKNELLKSPKEA